MNHTKKESDTSKSEMTFNLSEETLLFLLRCADNAADFDEFEKGFPDSARKTREMISSIVFMMNHKIGYEKYRFSNFSGGYYLDEVKRDKEAE